MTSSQLLSGTPVHPCRLLSLSLRHFGKPRAGRTAIGGSFNDEGPQLRPTDDAGQYARERLQRNRSRLRVPAPCLRERRPPRRSGVRAGRC